MLPYDDEDLIILTYVSLGSEYIFIYPYLSYCHLIWGKASASQLYRLCLLQKKAIRIICRADYYAHTAPLFEKCSIMKLEDLYKLYCSIFIFKYVNHLLPSPFMEKYPLDFQPSNHHHHVTRSSTVGKSYAPFCRTSICQNSLQYQCFKHYNDFVLPLTLLDHPSVHTLKKTLKSILM